MNDQNHQNKIKIINKIKGIEDFDDSLSAEEIQKIYNYIIKEITSFLKKNNFKKKTKSKLFRIENDEIYQSFIFQKSSYGANFTMETGIRPFFWNRPEDCYLLCNKRVGEYDQNRDKWYPINKNFNEIIEEIIKVITNKVIPIFNVANSSENILKYIPLLIENKIADKKVITFCALKSHNKKIALEYLSEIVETYNNDDRLTDWVINERKMYNRLYYLLDRNDFNEIDEMLNTYKLNFITVNKYLVSK